MRIAAGTYFNPEVSPDGQYALYVTTVRPDRNAIRVVRIADGSDAAFQIVCDIRRQSTWLIGRARWIPPGRSIAFVGQDDNGVNGIYTQDFVPGTDAFLVKRIRECTDPIAKSENVVLRMNAQMGFKMATARRGSRELLARQPQRLGM